MLHVFQGVGGRWYQGSPKDVTRQLFAIWNVLQRRGIRYSTITQPSGYSDKVVSQHVRFFDEVIRNSEANCVDGTVVFASILNKLAMRPVLAVKPGHMFLGLHLSKESCEQKRDILFLETTDLGKHGAVGNESESYREFVAALNDGHTEFETMVSSLNAHTPGFHVIEVASARRLGVAPIPRF